MKKILLLFSVSFSSLFGAVYDGFIFFNELEILEIRLEELDPVVDYFVLVEGTLTFSGEPKPLWFEENKERFQPYLHKIIHIIVDDYPLLHGSPTENAWAREIHQRNAITRGLKEAQDTDIVVISDVDEVLSSSAIDRIKMNLYQKRKRGRKKPPFLSLEMNLYKYQLNRAEYFQWHLALATTYKMLKTITPQDLRISLHYHPFGFPRLSNCGWHFSSMNGLENFIYKLKSFSHCYDQNVIEIQKKALLDFSSLIESFKPVPVDETFPKRVQRLLPEYLAKGWVAPWPGLDESSLLNK